MADTSTFSGAMKTKFIGPIRDQLYSNMILLEGLRTRQDDDTKDINASQRPFKGIRAEAEGIDFVGNEFRIPLRNARNQGIGSRAENAVLPAPGNEGFVQISEPMVHHYGLFNITGQLLKASESNEGAFKRALKVEMKGTTESLKRDVNIQAYGDASGSLATITATDTGVNDVPINTTIWFQTGEIVDIVNPANGTVSVAARTVTSIDRPNLTVTLSGATFNITTDHILVRSSSDSTTGTPNNSFESVTNGLANIVDDTSTLHTLDPATHQYWKSSIVDASGAVVGDALLRKLTDAIGFESGSDEDLLLITTRGIRQRYADTLTSNKRFTNSESVTLRGGYKALLFDDKPMVVDDHCPGKTVFGLNTDALFWSQMSDWDWMEEDGKVLKWEPRFDRYIAVLYKYCNFGTYARNRHGKIINGLDDVR